MCLWGLEWGKWGHLPISSTGHFPFIDQGLQIFTYDKENYSHKEIGKGNSSRNLYHSHQATVSTRERPYGSRWWWGNGVWLWMVMNKSFTIFHLSLLGLTFEFRILVVFVCLHPTTQKANSENSVPIGVKLEKQSKTNPKDLGGSAARWCLSRPKYGVNRHNLSETPLHNTHQYKRATSLAGIYSKEIRTRASRWITRS